ncbi:MAG: hypothetical protein IKX36_10210 [Prevotella sp.]|nr:hypothetical protein [Prevotella sp.]
MGGKNRKISKCLTLIIMLLTFLSSCKDYEPRDFYGKWYHNNTKFIFHEDGTLEIFNLDSAFVDLCDMLKSPPQKYYKGTWEIGKPPFDDRIDIGLDSIGYEFFIENENVIYDFIGDPDEWNRVIIRKEQE